MEVGSAERCGTTKAATRRFGTGAPSVVNSSIVGVGVIGEPVSKALALAPAATDGRLYTSCAATRLGGVYRS